MRRILFRHFAPRLLAIATLCLQSVSSGQNLPLITLETNAPPEIFHTQLPEISAEEGVRIAMDNNQTWPGERWLRGQVKLAPSLANGTTLRASVFGIAGEKSVGTIEKPAGVLSKVRLNLRGANVNKGRLRVEVLRGGQVVGADEVALQSPEVAQVADNTRIPVALDVDTARAGSSVGATFGVPFAAGALWDVARLSVVDGKGAAVPAQISPAALWQPDGSVKWARVDVAAPPSGELFVQVGNNAARPAPSTPVVVSEANGGVTVRIGATEYSLGAANSPIRALSQGGKIVATSEGARGLYIVDQTGRVGTASAKDSKITVESRGPVEATVKIDGSYLAPDGQELARHITRVSFFANQPQAQISHTFIITQDSNKIWFKEVGWEFKSGANANSAVFNTSAADWKQSTPVPLAAGESASMAQTEHFRFLQGENKFTLAKTSDAQSTPVMSGEESGDWAALTSATGGFLFGTREAARRHPKELLATANTLNVLLFSPKAGSELDFRSPQAIKDIGIAEMTKIVDPRVNTDATIKKLSAFAADARGWAKTHELVLSPIAAGQAVAEYAKPAALMSQPAQALSSPQWLYQTRVLGALHPYDPKTFPEIEEYASRNVAALDKFGDDFGEFGFRDYEAGPHFVRTYNPPRPLLKRWGVGYSTRADLWYFYARRGQRFVREFAEGSARAFHDNHMANWDGPQKVRGLYMHRDGGDTGKPDVPFNVPFYWGDQTVTDQAGTSNLDPFLLDYYLTGNRRAADAVRDYGAGMKKVWQPGNRTWRHMRLIFNLAQAYSLDWDEELGDLTRATATAFYDDEAALKIIEKPIGASYKTQSDFPGLVFVSEVLGDPRYEELTRRLADYWRDSYIDPPMRYGNPDAYVAQFLLERNNDPGLAESMAVKLRQMKMLAKKNKDAIRPNGMHAEMFAMHGFAVAQHIVKESGAWEKTVASAMGVQMFGVGPRWYVKKEAKQKMTLRLSYGASLGGVRRAATIGGRLTLRPLGFSSDANHDLHRVTSLADGAIVELAKEAPAGIYELIAEGEGNYSIVADGLVPLMAALPGAWQPLPHQLPMPEYFFEVPAASTQGAKITLSGRGKLTAPGSAALEGGKYLTGEIALKQAGVWKLQLEKPAVVRAAGFTPLFAADRAENLFALPEGVEINPEVKEKFAAPAGGIRIKPNETLTIDLPERDMEAGTVEYYYQPASELGEEDVAPKFLTVLNSVGRPATVNYIGVPEEDQAGYILQTMVPTVLKADRKQTSSVRGSRRHYFLSGQWNHLAFSWGIKRENYKGEETTTTRLFVDGELGNYGANQRYLHVPELKVKQITIGPGLDGTIAGVRVSSNPRYFLNFEPPAIGGDNWKDASTLGAWSLTGDIAAEAKQGALTLSKK